MKKSKNLIYGFGTNDADYIIRPIIDGKQTTCPFYQRWLDMIKRAYSPKYQENQPTYIGTTVCDKWKSFMRFKDWMIVQDWKGNQLDKDILFPGNKIYSPETCCFISGDINKLLTDRGTLRGKYKIGVDIANQGKSFRARIMIHGKKKNLGTYSTEQEAFESYIHAKIIYIESIFPEVSNDIKNGLKKHIKILKESSCYQH